MHILIQTWDFRHSIIIKRFKSKNLRVTVHVVNDTTIAIHLYFFFFKHIFLVNYLISDLSHLNRYEFVIELKKLYDLCYNLGLDESKEMTRGKYLNILETSK